MLSGTIKVSGLVCLKMTPKGHSLHIMFAHVTFYHEKVYELLQIVCLEELENPQNC